MNDQVKAAIAQAQAQAGELANANPPIDLAPVASAGGQVTGYAPSQVATLDGFIDSGSALKVDHWLQTSAFGFSIKNVDGLVNLDAPLGMKLPEDLQPFYGLRINIGGKPTYYKSVDRVSCVKTGKPWGTLMGEAAQQGQREYKGFDCRFRVLAPIKDAKGKVAVEAGKTLGYSTAVTNFADLQEFARKVREQGLYGRDLNVTVENEKRVNDKNPTGWGALIVTAFTAVEDPTE